MICFKIAEKENEKNENAVVIAENTFAPSVCTDREEAIVNAELAKYWYIEHCVITSTSYSDLDSVDVEEYVMYNIKASDAVLFENKVIGFLPVGCDAKNSRYNTIRGVFFSIEGREDFFVSDSEHRSYDHGDGDVNTTNKYRLKMMDPKKVALMDEYCIRYEKDEDVKTVRFKEIGYSMIKEKWKPGGTYQTVVSLCFSCDFDIPYSGEKKTLYTETVSLVKKADLVYDPLISSYMYAKNFDIYSYAIRNYVIYESYLGGPGSYESYKRYRAPRSDELVIEDGALTGFYIKESKYKGYLLKLDPDKCEVYYRDPDYNVYNAKILINKTADFPRFFYIRMNKSRLGSLPEDIKAVSKYVQIVSDLKAAENGKKEKSHFCDAVFKFTDLAFEDYFDTIRRICEFFEGDKITLLTVI